MRRARAATTVTLLGALLNPSWAAAQDPADPKPAAETKPQDADTDGAPEPGRRLARALLERRMKRLEEDLQRLRDAQRMLDEGKPLDEVRELFPELRERGGPGPDGAPVGPGGRRRPDGPEFGADPMADLGGPGDLFDLSDRPPGPPHHRGAESREALTPEARATVRDFLGAAMPRALALLDELETRAPQEAERKYQELLPRVHRMIDLRQRDPESYRLRLEDVRHGRAAVDAAQWIARHDAAGKPASDAERAEKTESLRASLIAQYDVRTRLARRGVEHMRSRLDNAAADIEKRPDARDGVVDQTIKNMIERERRRLGRGGDASPDHRPPGRGAPDRPRRGRPDPGEPRGGG